MILFAADMLQVAPDFLWYFRATAWLLKAKHQIFVGICHLFKDVCTWHIRKMTLCFACLHGMTMATLARGWERFVSPNLTGGLLIWIDLTDPTSQCQIWKIDSFWHQKVVEFIPNPRFARAGLQRDAALSWLAWCKIKWRQKVRIDLLEFAMWHHWRSKSLKMVEQISMTMETEVQIIFQA